MNLMLESSTGFVAATPGLLSGPSLYDGDHTTWLISGDAEAALWGRVGFSGWRTASPSLPSSLERSLEVTRKRPGEALRRPGTSALVHLDPSRPHSRPLCIQALGSSSALARLAPELPLFLALCICP